MVAQHSLEAAAHEALVIYRASLRSAEDVDAKLQRALRSASCLDPNEFGKLRAAYVRSSSLMRVSQRFLEKLIGELGYIPSIPGSSNFH